MPGQAVILDLVATCFRSTGQRSYITHNLGVVARLCHRAGVMYAGELMEEGTVAGLQTDAAPVHSGLLGCVPAWARTNMIVLNQSRLYPALTDLPEWLRLRSSVAHGRGGLPTAVRPTSQQTATLRTRPLSPLEELKLTPASSAEQHQRDYAHRQEGPVVLEARNVKKYFKVSRLGLGLSWRRQPPMVRAVDDISVRVRQGFTMGIVGESGCGKTTFARCIAGLEEATSGEMDLGGTRLPYAIANRPPALLKKIQMVFQNPDGSLNPQHTVGESVSRPLVLLGNVPKEQIDARVLSSSGP
jgi:peptide/nickel transport system ATP-binding protein